MQVLIYLWRIIKAGLHNFLRNGWLSVAATTVMVLTLFTISVFTLLNISISAATTSIQEKIDFQVFLSDGAPPALLDELQSELRANPFVAILCKTSSSSACVRAVTATRAPAPASASAMARPMPRPAPVTKATRSCNENMTTSRLLFPAIVANRL